MARSRADLYRTRDPVETTIDFSAHNGLLAARVIVAVEAEPWMPALVRTLYVANFVDDRKIGDREVVSDIVAGLVTALTGMLDPKTRYQENLQW